MASLFVALSRLDYPHSAYPLGLVGTLSPPSPARRVFASQSAVPSVAWSSARGGVGAWWVGVILCKYYS